MKRYFFLTSSLVLLVAATLMTAEASAASTSATGQSGKAALTQGLTAAQIVSKNVAARGGLKAWRAVHTLTLSGHMEAGGKKNTALPFVMQMERPRMSRLEIRFQELTAVQVYDGEHGWKVRPFLGRNEVEPFTPAETRAADTWGELDGQLLDYARKGSKVELLGTEAVEGHQAYKLQLTLKNGDKRHVWIDAANFLELKADGEPRMLDSRLRNVAIFYRDYKAEQGLKMPHVFETVVEGGRQSHKLFIEQVQLNRPLNDKLFAKPQLALASTAVRAEE